MVHLGTYHKQLVARYSRLSCIIELDTALAQHSHREVNTYFQLFHFEWVREKWLF